MNKITGYILLSFILLIGCKKYENNKFTTKYIKEEAVEYSLSPQLLPIDILNPTPKTVDSLMKLDLPSGVDIEIKL